MNYKRIKSFKTLFVILLSLMAFTLHASTPPINLNGVLQGTSIFLTWEMQTQMPTSFNLFRDNEPIYNNLTTTFFTDTTVLNNTEHVYHVTANYVNPVSESEPSNSFSIRTMFPINNLRFTFEGLSVKLIWDGYDVAFEYVVYKDGIIVSDAGFTALTFLDEDTTPGTTYTYGVAVKYVESLPHSEIVEITLVTPSFNPPRSLSATEEGNSIKLEWVEPIITNPLTSFVTLDGYIIFRDNEEISGIVTELSYLDSDIYINHYYTYYVIAVYSEPFGISVPSNSVTTMILSVNPPEGLIAETGNGVVILTWNLPNVNLSNSLHDTETINNASRMNNMDNSNDFTTSRTGLEFIGFRIYKNNTALPNLIKQTIYIDDNVTNQTTYSYYITAVYTDIESDSSNIEIITTRFPVRNLGKKHNGHNLELFWEAPIGGGATEYNIYRDTTLLNTITDLTYIDTTTTPAATYTYHVKAVYETYESPAVSIDVIIPLFSPPNNLNHKVESSSVTLTWEAPELMLPFEVLLYYIIERDGVEQFTTNDLTYTQHNVANGVYVYSVIAKYELGKSIAVDVSVEVDYLPDGNITEIPLITELQGNYPNPFNPETVISFNLSESLDVVIEIYNIKGQSIKTFDLGNLPMGHHKVIWNGYDNFERQVGSGVYFYQMKAADYTAFKRMVLMK